MHSAIPEATDVAIETADRRPCLTILMPARNEERNLPRAYEEVTRVMERLNLDYEVLVVDNHSCDATESIAAELTCRDLRWRYVRFSRDFSVEASIAAGLMLAGGDAAIVLFSDLQDPPDLIPEFVAKWQEGNDVVYGVVRKRTGDPVWKAVAARLFYRIMNGLSDVHLPENATDFRLLSRVAIDALNCFGERNRYVRGLAHWIGFQQCAIPYDRRARTAGKSKAPLFLMVHLASNAITCFSIKPLRLFWWFGIVVLLGTGALATAYVYMYSFADIVSGLTTIYLLLLANLGVLALGIGVLGEYIGRIYIESKNRPLFLVERAVNLDPSKNRFPCAFPDTVTTSFRHSAKAPSKCKSAA